MKKFILIIAFFILIIQCKNPEGESSSRESANAKPKDTLTLALDWRPNVLHSGIFIAEHKGWYDSLGLHLNWFSTEVDNYQKKPIWRVQDGEADLAIGPSEHIIHYSADQDTAPRVQAIGTILQKDQSAFITKKGSGLDRPKKLDSSTYGGYHTPLENEILTEMIKNDGGKGACETVNPPRLSVWDAFLQDSVDVVWVFLHWEAMELKVQGEEFNAFLPGEFGVPYGYSSVFFAPVNATPKQAAMYRKFLKASKKGYKFAAQNPERAARLLTQIVEHRNFNDTTFIKQAMQNIAPAFMDENGKWGYMRRQKFENYLDWLRSKGLSDTLDPVKAERLYSNAYLSN